MIYISLRDLIYVGAYVTSLFNNRDNYSKCFQRLVPIIDLVLLRGHSQMAEKKPIAIYVRKIIYHSDKKQFPILQAR